ncbi:MAG: hypothetical protein V1850_02970, partial [Candidatus Bathyarchaeota archaeon]
MESQEPKKPLQYSPYPFKAKVHGYATYDRGSKSFYCNVCAKKRGDKLLTFLESTKFSTYESQQEFIRHYYTKEKDEGMTMEQLYEHLSNHNINPEKLHVAGWEADMDVEWNRILEKHGVKVEEVEPVEREKRSERVQKDHYNCSLEGCNKQATKKVEYNGKDVYLCSCHDMNDYIYGT